MKCPKCGAELPEIAKFCLECGEKIEIVYNNTDNLNESASLNDNTMFQVENTENTETGNKKINGDELISNDSQMPVIVEATPVVNAKKVKKNRKIRLSKKALILIIAIIVSISAIAAGTVIAYNYLNNPVRKYFSYVDKNQIHEANSVYNNEIKSHLELVSNAQQEAEERASKIKDDYLNERITYDEAQERFSALSKAGDNSSGFLAAKNDVNSSYQKKIAYENAEKYANEGNYVDAIRELSKIDEQSANQKIEELKPKYKTDLLDKINKEIKNKNYEKALDLITESYDYLNKDDKDLTTKKSEIDKLIKKQKEEEKKKQEEEEKKRIEEAKNNQKVYVTSASTYDDGYYYVFRKATVVVKNNSDKVVKDVHLTILQFDNNGYPVDIEYSLYGTDNAMNATMNSANILQGATYGQNSYWDISDNATKIKACVKSVTFVDGSTWVNDYHSYWLENNKNKY